MKSVTRTLRASLLVAVIAVLAPAGGSFAQGTSGSLPGPINSQQLSRYADRLHLSASQRQALESIHDDYRVQFRTLRDGEIAAFLREQQSVQGGIPKREIVERLLDDVERLHTKIALLDNNLFDRLLPLLSEQQQPAVLRLRMMRERQRYSVQQTAAAFGRQTPDLADLAIDLDLAPGEEQAADVILAGYERKMTTIMRKQNEAILRMTLDMMDMLAERGYVDISQEDLLKDQALLQDVVGQVGEIYGDLRGRVGEYADELGELNATTLRQLAAPLPPDRHRQLRNAMYRVGYAQLGTVVGQSDRDWMAKALSSDELTDDERTGLSPIAESYQRRLDTILAEGADVIDDFWEGFSPFELNQERGAKLGEDLRALGEQAGEARARADSAATEQLGADTVARLREIAGRVGSGPVVADAGDATAAPDPTEAISFSGDRFLPDRISRRDIKRYARQLQLPDDMAGVFDVLHTDYLERLSTLAVLDELREARQAARTDASDASAEELGERIDRVYELRRLAIAAMTAEEATFFEEMRPIVGADRRGLLERVEGARRREALAGSASASLALGRDTSAEASLDLVTIVLEAQPDDDMLASIDELLTAYEGGASRAFEERLQAQLDMQRRNDRWMAEITAAARRDLGAVIELQTRYREEMREPMQRVATTDRVVVDLNRHTLEELAGVLPRDLAAEIRRAYDLAAFPSIWEDPASVDRHLAKALALDDLTAQQRAELTDLGASYRGEYEALSREMIEQLPTSVVNAVGLDPETFADWQRRQQQLAKIRFDRNELNGRAISRLQAMLTETQILRIGGLPEPLGEDDFFFYR
jgi:hypothetical protein